MLLFYNTHSIACAKLIAHCTITRYKLNKMIFFAKKVIFTVNFLLIYALYSNFAFTFDIMFH